MNTTVILIFSLVLGFVFTTVFTKIIRREREFFHLKNTCDTLHKEKNENKDLKEQINRLKQDDVLNKERIKELTEKIRELYSNNFSLEKALAERGIR